MKYPRYLSMIKASKLCGYIFGWRYQWRLVRKCCKANPANVALLKP